VTKPVDHEPWCAEHGYEECTCDLVERIARYEREHRASSADALPRALKIKSIYQHEQFKWLKWIWRSFTAGFKAGWSKK